MIGKKDSSLGNEFPEFPTFTATAGESFPVRQSSVCSATWCYVAEWGLIVLK